MELVLTDSSFYPYWKHALVPPPCPQFRSESLHLHSARCLAANYPVNEEGETVRYPGSPCLYGLQVLGRGDLVSHVPCVGAAAGVAQESDVFLGDFRMKDLNRSYFD